MLVAFPPILVADAKITYSYNFVAPRLIRALKLTLESLRNIWENGNGNGNPDPSCVPVPVLANEKYTLWNWR